MHRRIQEVLDGERPRDTLSRAEAAELDAYEEAIDAALAGVRAEAAPDVEAAVMRRVAQLPAHGPAAERGPGMIQRALDWLWAPRDIEFRFRPAWALAAAALTGLLVAGPLDIRMGAGPGAAPEGPGSAVAAGGAGAEAAGAPVFVHFRLDVQDARSVQLAGDFTDWQPRYTLHEVSDGVWSAVVPVQPGVHHYSFVIDGERWIVDPTAPAVDDGFGGANSRLDVVTPVRGGAL